MQFYLYLIFSFSLYTYSFLKRLYHHEFVLATPLISLQDIIFGDTYHLFLSWFFASILLFGMWGTILVWQFLVLLIWRCTVFQSIDYDIALFHIVFILLWRIKQVVWHYIVDNLCYHFYIIGAFWGYNITSDIFLPVKSFLSLFL
jgi:hypothetical protein